MTQNLTPVTVGITGGSASGKSTLAKHIANELNGHKSVIVNQDLYFRDYAEYSPEEREKVITANHPDGICWDVLINHINKLVSGEPVTVPASGTRAALGNRPQDKLETGDLIILEGHLIFWNQQIRDLMDLKLFIDVDPHERVLRRLLRAAAGKEDEYSAKDLQWQVEWYRRDVIPNFPVYTETCKQYADLVVPYQKHNPATLQMIVAGIRDRIMNR